MKKKILIIFYFLMSYLGVIRLFYWINRQKKLVLTYHHIIPDDLYDNSFHLGVSHIESIFVKQVKLIRRRFGVEDKVNGTNRCLITFDDGYKNQIEIAAKILNNNNLRGIFFISFQSVITGHTLIIDKVMMWLSHVPVGNYRLLNFSITINDANRHLVATKIYELLLENCELWKIIESELNKSFSFNALLINPKLERLRFKPLELDDLKILAKDGHVVGAHSWSHRPLGTLSPEVQREDFLSCVSYANKYCNSKLYSYPFGDIQEVSPLTAKLCEEYGFTAAYMNIPISPAWADINMNFTLPRISLPNESNQYVLDAKLSGFELFCKKIAKRCLTSIDSVFNKQVYQ